MSGYVEDSETGDKFWVWFELGGRGWVIAREDEDHYSGATLVRLEIVGNEVALIYGNEVKNDGWMPTRNVWRWVFSATVIAWLFVIAGFVAWL